MIIERVRDQQLEMGGGWFFSYILSVVSESIFNGISAIFWCQDFDLNRFYSNGLLVEFSCIFELIPAI